MEPARLMGSGALRLSAWYFAYFAFLGAFGPYFALYLHELGVAAFGIAATLALMQLMRVLLPVLWAPLRHFRGGRKAAVVRAAFVVALVAWGGVAISGNFAGLFLSVALLALALGVALPLAEALTLDFLAPRAERYGHIRLWGSLGYIVSVQAVGFALQATSTSALPAICLGLLVAGFAVSVTLPESAQRLSGTGASDWRGLFRHPGVAAVMAAGFFMSFAHAPYYAFYSLHLIDHGYGKSAIGALWGLGVFVEVGVFVVMPRLLSVARADLLLAISLGTAVVRFLSIGWWIDSLPLAILAQTFHAATFGLHHAASMAALNRWVPPAEHAPALAAFGSLGFGAGSLGGAFVCGALWDRFGAGPVYSVAACAAAVGLGVLVRGGVLRRKVEL